MYLKGVLNMGLMYSINLLSVFNNNRLLSRNMHFMTTSSTVKLFNDKTHFSALEQMVLQTDCKCLKNSKPKRGKLLNASIFVSSN